MGSHMRILWSMLSDDNLIIRKGIGSDRRYWLNELHPATDDLLKEAGVTRERLVTPLVTFIRYVVFRFRHLAFSKLTSPQL